MADLKFTTRRIGDNPRHVRFRVWQNGGMSGELCVEAEHAEAVERMLSGEAVAQVAAVRAICDEARSNLVPDTSVKGVRRYTERRRMAGELVAALDAQAREGERDG